MLRPRYLTGFLCFGFLLFVSPLSSGQAFRFNRSDFALGTNPGGVAVADFNRDGKLDVACELLSYWYDIGYKPKQSASDSLGVCRPRLCVSYKFDDEGSGRMDKIVQHTPGKGNLEPDSEEHYNFDGVLDERVEIKYVRDDQGNWTARSVFVWDAPSNQMIEIERDTRTIEYY
jgi:hypothetical protein